MACYNPKNAWYSETPHVDTGKPYLVFQNPFPSKIHFEPMQISCNRCIGCRLDTSKQWAIRCAHEAQLHPQNCFLTLTYDDANLPQGNSLHKPHFQNFMKRLRIKYDTKIIRYYMCGEYGDNFNRPHYHAILFNHNFADKTLQRKTATGNLLWQSKELDDLWSHGHCTIGECSFQSAGYIARYVTKKITGHTADQHYQWISPTSGEIHQRIPEYTDMSRRPGIASEWIKQYKTDVFPDDFIIIDQKKYAVPRYYNTFHKKFYPTDHKKIIQRRKEQLDANIENTTPERLAVREKIQYKKYELLQRNKIK